MRFTRLAEESTGKRWKIGSRLNVKSTPSWKSHEQKTDLKTWTLER